MKTFDVLSFGELLWDVNSRAGERHLGGAPANLAFHLQQRGISTALVTKVGYDSLGVEATSLLKRAGIDLSHVQSTGSLNTGVVDVLDRDGGVDYIIRPNAAYDDIKMNGQLAAAAREAKVVCFGTLVQRSTQSRETLYELLDTAKGAKKLLDINLRKDCFSAETVARSLGYANILKLNTEVNRPEMGEVHRVAELIGLEPGSQDETIARILERFPSISCCLVTKAEQGVDAYVRGAGLVLSSPPYPVGPVVSVVGAGDCFTAGFVAAYIGGREIEGCVDAGLRLASVKVTRPGAMAVIADAELTQLPDLPRSPSFGSAAPAREMPRER